MDAVVGVVGDEALAASVEAAGVDTVVGDAESVLAADVSTAVAGGQAALLSLTRSGVDVPVLPVEAGRGLRSVPQDAVTGAVERLDAGATRTETHTLLDVAVAGESVARALFDIFLVTAAPAHISEYAVAAGEEPVTCLRADGVVVATPAGTGGYAGRAGAPVVPPGPDVLAIVPVAPFSTTRDHWVVPDGDLRLAVEREEAEVELRVDDRVVRSIGPDDDVRVTPDGSLDVIVAPASRSPFGRQGSELEKL
ncbi:ATP-NAD kinase [Halobacteriales archaeon Cl-PHB]